MKFKKYIKESVTEAPVKKLILDEAMETDPDFFFGADEVTRLYAPVNKLIKDEKFDEAKVELDALEKDLNEYEAENSKKRFFRTPAAFFESQKNLINKLRSQLPVSESIEDMDKRCPECNTLLNDGGTCPKCDEGEEDYGDAEDMNEELTNKEKLQRAYPELNFDNPAVEESIQSEAQELSVREKLKRAYPELNFDKDTVTEAAEIEPQLTNREKLKKAYPELNFDSVKTEELDKDPFDYDDEYEVDDVELDKRHAALYGGDRMYCDCGSKLSYNEYGSYCPNCTPEEPDQDYEEDQVEDVTYDDEI